MEAAMNELRSAALKVLRFPLGLMEKQVRMIAELADAAPLAQRKEEIEGNACQADFVVVGQQRLREIVKQMRVQLNVMKVSVELAESDADELNQAVSNGQTSNVWPT
jgi:tRNA U34 2-thiouridine synthase MnmA/TrmU